MQRFGKLMPLLILVLVFTTGFALGGYTQRAEVIGGKPVDLGNFWEAKRLIESKYPGDVNGENLITGATKGLVEGVGDPYSSYLTPEEAKQLNQSLAGTVEGIGVEIGQQGEQPIVIAPLPDSPALRAGIAAGDLILSVNSEPTTGKSLDEIAQKIRGPKGTEVTVEVKSATGPVRSLKLTRETVKSPSVTVTYRDNVAIIDLSRFGETTQAELNQAITDIQSKKPRGIVLDLRSNPGGFLDGAVSVSSVFLKSGTVVKEKYKDKTDEDQVKPDGRLADFPLVVLVNKGSASAAEITAGALRDNRQIKLVGEKTFGKGSVQELEQLSGGAVLKLTIAEWLTPSGLSISKQGLDPDVPVPSDNPEAQLQAAITQFGR